MTKYMIAKNIGQFCLPGDWALLAADAVEARDWLRQVLERQTRIQRLQPKNNYTNILDEYKRKGANPR